jgi:hypothetical protein
MLVLMILDYAIFFAYAMLIWMIGFSMGQIRVYRKTTKELEKLRKDSYENTRFMHRELARLRRERQDVYTH